MYIAVCDDLQEELDALEKLLQTWQRDRRVNVRYRTFHSAAELLDHAEKTPFTLYLLDVIMPGTDGLAAAREIRSFDDTAEIVFLTVSPGFAYESYSVRAMDYLLKPIRADKLFPILDRLLLREQRPKEGLTLKCGATLIRIPYAQISHVEVSGKHLYFNLTDGTVREVVGSLTEYDTLLRIRPEFMRVHRSYIVNLQRIRSYVKGRVFVSDSEYIPIGENYRETFQRYIETHYQNL